MVPSPMEFMGRLAALVPKPRVNLTRFHGVFSPHSKLREYIVSQHPVKDQVNPKKRSASDRAAFGRAQRLKRVFATKIDKCEKCGGPSLKVILEIWGEGNRDPYCACVFVAKMK